MKINLRLVLFLLLLDSNLIPFSLQLPFFFAPSPPFCFSSTSSSLYSWSWIAGIEQRWISRSIWTSIGRLGRLPIQSVVETLRIFQHGRSRQPIRKFTLIDRALFLIAVFSCSPPFLIPAFRSLHLARPYTTLQTIFEPILTPRSAKTIFATPSTQRVVLHRYYFSLLSNHRPLLLLHPFDTLLLEYSWHSSP